MAMGSDDPSRRAVEPVVPPGWPADAELPVAGWGDVAMPIDELWEAFTDVERWHVVEPVHQARPGEGRPAARGRHAGVDVPADQALVPVRDAG